MLLASQNTGRGGTGTPEAKAPQVETVRLLAEYGATWPMPLVGKPPWPNAPKVLTISACLPRSSLAQARSVIRRLATGSHRPRALL